MPKGIEPSNLSKVFWPDAGITKGDLLAYFEAVAPFVLPELRGRPLTVRRYPDGIEGMTFYQKNTPKYAPDWVPTVTVYAGSAKRDVAYTLCNSKRVLLWLANQASIELHPWLSRADRLEWPDRLVMDLDPPEGRFELAVEVAFAVKEVLGEVGLESLIKTSGAKGLHVVVPLVRRHRYDMVRAAADAIAGRVQERIPDLATTAFHLAKRGGRLFLDTGRNAPGAHVVTVYSPRARPGGPVSFPVAWKDLRRVRPGDFTVQNVPAILERRGDVWRALLPRPESLPRALFGSRR